MAALPESRVSRHAVKDHLPEWMLGLVAEGAELLAASPYITDGRLFEECDPRRTHLYTAFHSLNFISRASSLRVLKQLLERGIRLHHVEGLHAKVVMVGGEHFSLGSQNLTVRGRQKNIEASMVSGTDTPAHDVHAFFARLHRNARPISAQDILEMEAHIAPWLEKFKEIDRGGKSVDESLTEARRQREAGKLSAAVSDRHRLAVHIKHFYNTRFDFNKKDPGPTRSLAPKKGNFIRLVASLGFRPEPLFRYLLIDQDSGKLAYARLAGTRISYFGKDLLLDEDFIFRHQPFRVRIVFERDPVLLRRRNVVAELTAESAGTVPVGSADYAFSADRLEFQGSSVPPWKAGPRLLVPQLVEDALRSQELAGFLTQWLAEPFQFEENIGGPDAIDFFGDDRSVSREITAIPFNGNAVLSVRTIPAPDHVASSPQ